MPLANAKRGTPVSGTGVPSPAIPHLAPSMPVRRPRILAIGHAVLPTGLARVFESLFAELCTDFDIIQFGLNYYGDPPTDRGWIIESNRVLGDPQGIRQLSGLLVRYQPDIVLICYDYWLFGQLQPILSAHPGPVFPKSVVYCPIEGRPAAHRSFAPLSNADLVVAYTEYGRMEIADALRRCSAGLRLPRMIVLPHGVDCERFFPLHGIEALEQNRCEARRRLFPERPDLENAFIVLNANRNVPRKRIDCTLKAFAGFASDKPNDVYLYLHMGMHDRGIRVRELAASLEIADRLLTTTDLPDMPHISDLQLNLVYNACDVGMNTSTGEGWGLVAFEHAATGALQIVPDHTACRELWQDAGVCVAVHRDDPDPFCKNTPRTGAMVSALEHAFGSQSDLARGGYEMVTHRDFSWQGIADRWRVVFRNLIGA